MKNALREENREKMKKKIIRIFVSLLLSCFLFEDANKVEALECMRRNPSGVEEQRVEPRNDDSGFHLFVSGNPQSYQPGELYTVSLKVSTM